jgi:hypothetical protein
MKLPRVVGLLLAPVLFGLGLVGFVMMVIGKGKRNASADLNVLEQPIRL